MRRCLSFVLVLSCFVVTLAPTVAAGPNDCVTWVTDLNPQGTRITANADDTITVIVAASKGGEGAAAGFIIQPDACDAKAPDGAAIEQIERQAGLPNAFDYLPGDVPGGHGAHLPTPVAPGLP